MRPDCNGDFAHAYYSVAHAAILTCMPRRGVPDIVSTAYLREMLSSEMVFQHVMWRTERVTPDVCLRQGCSLSPMLHRCVMTDALSELAPRWHERCFEINIGTHMRKSLC